MGKTEVGGDEYETYLGGLDVGAIKTVGDAIGAAVIRHLGTIACGIGCERGDDEARWGWDGAGH